MRFWDLSGPEVAAADAEPWDMPFSFIMRSISTQTLVRLYLGATVLFLLSGVSGVLLALAAGSAAVHPGGWITFHVVAILLGLLTLGLVLSLSPHLLRRTGPSIAAALLLLAPALVAAGLATSGPSLGIVALAFTQAPLFAYYVLHARWAIVFAVWLLSCFGLLMVLQDGWAAPFQTWLFVAANVLGTGEVIGLLALRADELAASEHEARVELANLNHTLEERVDGQVAEIERLSGLRRFLSTQVADVVLAGDTAGLTEPHRARIAVFCCDLRGFTAFTNTAEPEEVVGVLDEYYGAVGGLLERFGATIGDYAGDGIMAYFGDPVPRPDAALAAVAMTREVGGVMAGVVKEWQRRGYDLDYGIGVAHGYATLGLVGFDGRYDYKPVGAVVNLAARLCAHALGGQVLLDHATHAETTERFPSVHCADLDLKGYAGAIRAYALG